MATDIDGFLDDDKYNDAALKQSLKALIRSKLDFYVIEEKRKEFAKSLVPFRNYHVLSTFSRLSLEDRNRWLALSEADQKKLYNAVADDAFPLS